MQVIALLRGVMPTGKNKIPKMSFLVNILEDVGFKGVKSHIQSGNILLETDLSHSQIADNVHNTILEKIGAKLPVIIKTKEQLSIAIKENPFNESYEFSRIHLVFTNTQITDLNTTKLDNTVFDGELFYKGSECLYMYLPRDASKKKLNNNYLEKQLCIVSTMRKLNVITHLQSMLDG